MRGRVFGRSVTERHGGERERGAAELPADDGRGGERELEGVSVLAECLSVKPRIGVSRTLGAEEVTVEGERSEVARWQVFPTVQLGDVF